MNSILLSPAIQRKELSRTSSPNDKQQEIVSKLRRCNASYKMIATAQAAECEGDIEELRTHGDKREDMGLYCAKHAAVLERTNGKELRQEGCVEGKKLSIPPQKVSESSWI